MTKLVKWIEKPVNVGGVPWDKSSVLIMLGIVFIGCAALGLDFLNILFYLGISFSVLGHLIFWIPKFKNKVKTMFNKLL